MKKTILVTGLLMAALSIPAACEEVTEVNEPAAETAAETPSTTSPAALMETVDEYVKLGNYADLELEKVVYPVAEEDIQAAKDNLLYETGETVEVDGNPQLDDVLTLDLTIDDGEETQTYNDYNYYFGYADLGEELEDALSTAKKDDTFEVTQTFTEDSYYEDWAGKDITFSGKVLSISRLVPAEPTDEWVKENTDASNAQEWEENIRKELEVQNENRSHQELVYAAIASAMAEAEFTGYPQELYDEAKAAQESQMEMIAQLYGLEGDNIYEAFGLTEENMEEQIIDEVNRSLFLCAVAKESSQEVTEDDIRAFAEASYMDAGYPDADSFLQDYGPDELEWYALEDKVGSYIISLGQVTTINYDEISYENVYGEDFEYETGSDDDMVYNLGEEETEPLIVVE